MRFVTCYKYNHCLMDVNTIVNIPDPKELAESRNRCNGTANLFRNAVLHHSLIVVVDKIQIRNMYGITSISLNQDEIVPKLQDVSKALALIPLPPDVALESIVKFHDILNHITIKLREKSEDYIVSRWGGVVTIKWDAKK